MSQVLDGQLCEGCYAKNRERPATELQGGVPLCNECACDTTQSRFRQRTFNTFDPEPGFASVTPPSLQLAPTSPAILAIPPAPIPVQIVKAPEPQKPELRKPKPPVNAVPARIASCERCGKEFDVKLGTAGRFCSRDCYRHKEKTVKNDVSMPASEYSVVPNLCSRGCGKATHRGICKGQTVPKVELEAKHSENVSRTVDPDQVPEPTSIVRQVPGQAMTLSHSIERSMTQTHKETLTINVPSHEVNRKISIIIPKLQPVTQVRLTPQIAEIIWSSLSKEQKFDLMDIEGLWGDYDDDLKMMTIDKVLLVRQEEKAS